MNQLPSQSISKSVLFATPLFLFVLAILHASSQLSYMFILDFVNNMGGSADIIFIPTLQPEVPSGTFYKTSIFNAYGFDPMDAEKQMIQNIGIPLVNIPDVDKWIKENPIVKGGSPRWVFPTKTDRLDTYLFAMNVSKQILVGLADESMIKPLQSNHAAVESSLLDLLGLGVGDKISVEVQPKNILAGMKMFEKYQEASSNTEQAPEIQEVDPKTLAQFLYNFLEIKDSQMTKEEFTFIVEVTFDQKTVMQFMIQERLNPTGLYPSQFHNVIAIDLDDFYWVLAKWFMHALVNVGNTDPKIKQFVPDPYRSFWPNNSFQASFQVKRAYEEVSKALQDWSLMVACRLNDRQFVYNPSKGPKYNQFAVTLESMPGSVNSIVLYPVYKESLAIKYFFDSVIQIFQFVSCILYFYTMTLIMKQIYEEKQIEVAVWRTLGAGAVSKSKKFSGEEDLRGRNVSQFRKNLTIKQKFEFYGRVAIKVGFLMYWLTVVAGSAIIYVGIKLAIYHFCAKQLKFTPFLQPISLPIIISFIILAFIFALCLHHIKKIFTDPLSETIKPVKRTFDLVKVRVIHLATFGVSVEVLMIAVMLIYYGVVSYYWIPYAILDGNENLQIFLLNTIFIFMIFGAIILLSIFQSRLQILIFKLIFRLSKRFRCLKSTILKNIKAKQYKNIKVAIIISIIFAFVLFFTTGINIQIQIIQSFIERALGSDLVFENYGRTVFDAEKVNEYLNTKKNIEYAWLSERIDRDGVGIYFISPVTGNHISPQIQLLSPTYLNSTFYEYYYPQQYLPESKNYQKLPNKIPNGFNSIYTGPNWSESVGQFDPDNTLTQKDPNSINTPKFDIYNPPFPYDASQNGVQLPPEEQIIDLVVSTSLRKQLGVGVGQIYKMQVSSGNTGKAFYIRGRIAHSFKQGPGFDILRSEAFMSRQQAQYIYDILQENKTKLDENEKLFIKGEREALSGISNAIISMSPEQTQDFDIDYISGTFDLLERYLNGFIVFITAIMSGLAVLFLFLYTIGKCGEQAEMYKMLRAIGLNVFKIRLMVFLEIIIRIFVSIFNGIVLGIILSLGFSAQVQEFLMLKTPSLNLNAVLMIAAVLLLIFSVTVIQATRYLSKRTVSETNKKI